MGSAIDRVTRTAHERYDDKEVADAVLADAVKNNTIDRIDSGELVLPHPQDAKRWHNMLTGKADLSPTEQAQQSKIQQLEQRLQTLEHELSIPPALPPHNGDSINPN